MTLRPSDNGTGSQPESGKRAALPFAGRRRSSRRRPNRRLCIVVGSNVLAVALCGVAAYLWRAPLPSLVIPEVAEMAPAPRLIGSRSGAQGSLELCLRLVKMRDLFKPSIPVPSEGGLGKSTAQELAERLQFVGTMDDAGGLAALVFIPNRGPGTYHVGDRVAEFVLKDVQPGHVILELGDEEAVLKR